MKPRILPLLLLGLVSMPLPSFASVPQAVTVQGILRDGAGRLQSMTGHFTVSFYDDVEGGDLVAGPFGPTETAVENGLFTLVLRTPAFHASGGTAARGVWLEIVEGNTIFPRQAVTADAYALAASTADSADRLSESCSGCVSDLMISAVSGDKVQGKVPAAAWADHVENGVYSNMAYFDPPWLTGVDGRKVAGKVAEAMIADTAMNVLNGVFDNRSYADPDFIASLGGHKITGILTAATVPASQVIGKVAEAGFADVALSVPDAILATGRYDDPAWLGALSGSKITSPVDTAMKVSGAFAGDVTGTQAALKLFAIAGRPLPKGDPGNGQFLRYDDTIGEWVYGSFSPSDISAMSNQYVGLTGDQIISGDKTFQSPIAGDILGNAATVTDGVYLTGRYADPAFIVSIDALKVSGKVAAAGVADRALLVDNGVYENVTYFDPQFIASLDGAKITGKVGAAVLADRAASVDNGVYANAAYNDPGFIVALAGTKIVGPVGDSAALGGAPAADYQLAMKNGCAPGTYVTRVSQSGEPECAPGSRSAFGSASFIEIEPDFKNTVAHLVIDAPGPGYVEVTATYQVTANNHDGFATKACTVETQLADKMAVPAPSVGYQALHLTSQMNTGDGLGSPASFPGAVTTRIPVVVPGPVTLYLSGASDCPRAAWVNVAMHAAFHAGPDATVAFGIH